MLKNLIWLTAIVLAAVMNAAMYTLQVVFVSIADYKNTLSTSSQLLFPISMISAVFIGSVYFIYRTIEETRLKKGREVSAGELARLLMGILFIDFLILLFASQLLAGLYVDLLRIIL